MRRLFFAVLLVALMLGCTPLPPVPPGPTPADPFAGAIVDCGSPEVEGQRWQIETSVRSCLVGERTSACLIEMLPAARVDTVACAVRRLGQDENRRVLAGDPGTDSTTIDNAARAWIVQEGIGYR